MKNKSTHVYGSGEQLSIFGRHMFVSSVFVGVSRIIQFSVISLFLTFVGENPFQIQGVFYHSFFRLTKWQWYLAILFPVPKKAIEDTRVYLLAL